MNNNQIAEKLLSLSSDPKSGHKAIAYLKSGDGRGIYALLLGGGTSERSLSTVTVIDGKPPSIAKEVLVESVGGPMQTQLAKRLAFGAADHAGWSDWALTYVQDDSQQADILASWVSLTDAMRKQGGVQQSGGSSTGLLIGGAALLAFLLLRGRK